MKILRTKYKEAVDEIKDLSNEHFKEKEFLLETVRDMEKEMEFFKSLVKVTFNHEETDKIRIKSKYDFD